MAIRPSRALVGLATAAAVLILPASALAAETLSVSPSSTQAGGNPSLTETLGFAPGSGDTPKTVVLSTAPGLLANLNANPSCLGAQQLTAACLIGTASLTATVLGSSTTENGNLYLVPPQGSDVAGVEFVGTTPAAVSSYVGVSLNPSAAGALNLTTTLPQTLTIAGTAVPLQVTQFSSTFNPTLNGQPFTRLPSSCNAASNTMSVKYYGATPAGSATSSFTPTGCANLPYNPTLAVSEAKDAKDNGATLGFDITQAANEAASKTIVLKLPSGLGVNLGADVTCLTGAGTGCVVGTATATSPLVPSAAFSGGTVSLGGSATTPTVTVSFPALGITLVGDVSLAGGTVTIANVPDVPLTSLDLTITGPNGQKAFTTSCTPSSTTGTFTSQSGVTKTVTSTVTLTNCASATASGSASGLATGHPRLKLQVKDAANIASVAVGLPTGLTFSRSGIVSSKTCVTKKGKKKCTTTTLIKGLGVSGASVKSVALKGGKLVITLKKAAGSVTVSLSGPILSESKSLQTGVKKHKVKSLTVTLTVTDAKHTTTSVPLKLTAH